jgi:hypothetical protein
LYAFRVHFWIHFWLHFQAFSKKLKTLIFDDLTTLLEGFTIQKHFISKPFFDSFFVPISEPPSGRLFSLILTDQSADRHSSGRFRTVFGTPLGSKMEPRGAQGLPKTVHKRGPGGDPCPQGSREPFFSVLEPPFGGKGGHLGLPWVTECVFLGPLDDTRLD